MPFSFLTSENDRETIGSAALEKIKETYGSRYPDQSLVAEISCASADEIRELNRDYREIDEPTDVLSFPTFSTLENLAILPRDIPVLIGSIVVCPAKAQAYDETLPQLIHHGLLHLLGYDHEDDFQKWNIEERKMTDALSADGLIIPLVTND
jgi:probable rRNA maturation factor